MATMDNETAQQQLAAFLQRDFSDSDKIRVFDELYPRAKEVVEQLLASRSVRRQLTEMFDQFVLLAIWGKDFYDIAYAIGDGKDLIA